MHNYPNIYTSYGPGMPIISGVPGSFLDAMKKVLVTGTDPVSISPIVVLAGVATITMTVDDQVFLNGARIAITGCDEPQLNNIFEVDYHSRLLMKFNTSVADGTYGGSNLKINQPAAGWNLLFTGTNVAVFSSGNMNSLGVCVKITDTNALYADFEFYENMTSLNDGVNKWNPVIHSPTRVTRFFKSRNATAVRQEYWIAADNTNVHISVERIYTTAVYSPTIFQGFRGGVLTSFGECQSFNNLDKRNFYFNSSGRSETNDGVSTFYYGNTDTFSPGQFLGVNYDFVYYTPYWNGCLLTENSFIGNSWTKLCIYPTFIHAGNVIRMSGGSSRIQTNNKLPPLYLMSDSLVYSTDPFSASTVNTFGRIKELLYANQQIVGAYRNGSKISFNGKKYILLPIYKYTDGIAWNSYDNTVMGMIPILIGESWG